MKLDSRFTFDTVRFDQENELHLVVSLIAPKKDWEEERAPICVVPVIDVSGSMAGEPLDYAKKSALKLVDHLTDKDYCGVVIFDSYVTVVSPTVQMTSENKTLLQKKIGDLRAGSCTNFCGGMLAGLEQLNKSDLPKDMIFRAIMLTDGHANAGPASDYQGLKVFLLENARKASVSCFGYGQADQDLLSALSKDGKGNYAFIENPDDAISAFAKELGGLLSTFAQNLELTVKPSSGHEIIEVISDVDVGGDDNSVKILLPEILSEEERHLVIKVKLSKQTKALPRKMSPFNIELSYDEVTKDGKIVKKSVSGKAQVQFVKTGNEQKKPTKDVDELVALAETVKAQIEAEEMAKIGNFKDARIKLRMMSDNFLTRGLVDYATTTNDISETMVSSQVYTSSASYLNTTKMGMTRIRGVSGMEKNAAANLKKLMKGKLNNEAQDALQKSFAKDDDQNVAQDFVANPNSVATLDPKVIIKPVVTKSTDDQQKIDKSSLRKKRSERW